MVAVPGEEIEAGVSGFSARGVERVCRRRPVLTLGKAKPRLRHTGPEDSVPLRCAANPQRYRYIAQEESHG